MSVKIALEKGIKYECKENRFLSRLNFSLKPILFIRKVRCLIHYGKPVCESFAILVYINEAWKDHNLLPSNPYDKSQVRFWAQSIDRKLFDNAGTKWKLKGEEQEVGKKDLIHCFGLLQKELGDNTYFGGEIFGYLDIALISYASWFYTYENFGNFSIEAVCPKSIAWVKRCMRGRVWQTLLKTLSRSTNSLPAL